FAHAALSLSAKRDSRCISGIVRRQRDLIRGQRDLRSVPAAGEKVVLDRGEKRRRQFSRNARAVEEREQVGGPELIKLALERPRTVVLDDAQTGGCVHQHLSMHVASRDW